MKWIPDYKLRGYTDIYIVLSHLVYGKSREQRLIKLSTHGDNPQGLLMKRLFKTSFEYWVWNTSLDYGLCFMRLHEVLRGNGWWCYPLASLGRGLLWRKGAARYWMQVWRLGYFLFWLGNLGWQFLLHESKEPPLGLEWPGQVSHEICFPGFLPGNLPRDWRSALCPRHGGTFLAPEFQTPLNWVLHS